MAITILNKPTTPNVTDTKLVYSISSSNALQPQFNYVTDIYPSGSSTLLTRLFTYPNLSGNGIVDIAKVLDDSLTYQTDFYNSGSSYLDLYGKFDVKFGEAYGSSISSSVTIYDDLTSDYIEVFPGIVDANSGNLNFPSSSYIPTISNTGDINLSVLPRNPVDIDVPANPVAVPIEEDHYSTINFLKSTNYRLWDSGVAPNNEYQVFLFYDMSVYSPSDWFDVWDITFPNGITYSETGILSFGEGPANLKQLSTLSAYKGETLTQGFDREWVMYAIFRRADIQFFVNAPISDSVYYNPNASDIELAKWLGREYPYRLTPFRYCNTPTRFAFINKNGTWDYYNVYAPLKRDTDVNRNIYEQNYVDYSSNTSIYSYEKRGEKQYLTGYTDRFNITTPYLLETEADYITNLLDSPEVFVQEGDNFIPIVITNSDYTWNMNQNRQKLFQYTIEYRYANQRYDR